jgi:hypothetical protein
MGYRMVYEPGSRKQVREHVLVWTQKNGPVPDGLEIHHVNGDKLDNRIENLICVDHDTHFMLEWGYELIDGEWWKRCPQCHLLLPLSYYPRRGKRRQSFCDSCGKIAAQRRVNPYYIPIVGEPERDSAVANRMRNIRRNGEIKRLYDAGVPASDLAKQFNLGEYYIVLIATGRRGIAKCSVA